MNKEKTTTKTKKPATKKIAQKKTTKVASVKKAAPKTVAKKVTVKKAAPKTATKKVTVKKAAPKTATKKVVETKKDEIFNENRFAVVELQGEQIKIYEGKKYEVDFMEGEKGSDVVLDKVLLFADGDKVQIGKPYLEKIKVKALIDSQKKDTKVKGVVFKAKSRYRRTYGHRALITRLLVKEISN